MEKQICEDCGRLINPESETLFPSENGGYICGGCINKYRRCSCGKFYKPFKGDANWCKKCDEAVYFRAKNNYSTKPRLVFKNFNYPSITKEMGCRYYGLEMEYNNVNADTILGLGNEKDLYTDKFLYNKSDGSICNGVEIVTAPLDKKSVKQLIKNMEPIFQYVRYGRYKEGAGLHIHVNNTSIDPLDRYKLRVLMNLEASMDEKSAMYYLCGRTLVLGSEINDHYFQIGGREKIVSPHGSDRYQALNSCNKFTTEFRLFKSSADPDVILSYIELVDKIIEYAHKFKLTEMVVSRFLMWLESNTKNKVILDRLSYIKSDKYTKDMMSAKQKNRFMIDSVVKELIDSLAPCQVEYALYQIANNKGAEEALKLAKTKTTKRKSLLTKEEKKDIYDFAPCQDSRESKYLLNKYKLILLEDLSKG